jgi:excisionase family DNA binding protein
MTAVPMPLHTLTRQDVAEALACEVSTVDRLIARGALRAIRVGQRAVRITLEDYLAYVKGAAILPGETHETTRARAPRSAYRLRFEEGRA